MLKLFPLLGAMPLSVTSVQANELSHLKASEDWLISACAKSEGNKTLCSLLKIITCLTIKLAALQNTKQGEITPNLFDTYVSLITEVMKTESNKFEADMLELGFRDAINTNPPCSDYLRDF